MENVRRSYCVRRVKAALVIEVGRFKPLVISLQIFLFITSTRPPFSVTNLYSMYRSNTCLAMMGIRFTGVPGGDRMDRSLCLNFLLDLNLCWANQDGNCRKLLALLRP